MSIDNIESITDHDTFLDSFSWFVRRKLHGCILAADNEIMNFKTFGNNVHHYYEKCKSPPTKDEIVIIDRINKKLCGSTIHYTKLRRNGDSNEIFSHAAEFRCVKKNLFDDLLCLFDLLADNISNHVINIVLDVRTSRYATNLEGVLRRKKDGNMVRIYNIINEHYHRVSIIMFNHVGIIYNNKARQLMIEAAICHGFVFDDCKMRKVPDALSDVDIVAVDDVDV